MNGLIRINTYKRAYNFITTKPKPSKGGDGKPRVLASSEKPRNDSPKDHSISLGCRISDYEAIVHALRTVGCLIGERYEEQDSHEVGCLDAMCDGRRMYDVQSKIS
jgi:hypothetical protein